MGGFTGKGEDSIYVQTLDFIWKTGDYCWEHTGESKFYEYWPSRIALIDKLVWQREAKTNRIEGGGSYYGYNWNFNRPNLAPNNPNRGPFGSVIDFIEELNVSNIHPGNKCLYVVVSDMHEQNREDDVFVLFFRRLLIVGSQELFLQ